MIRIRKYNKAFSVIEYVILFVIVMAGLLMMINYVQRGVFGNWGKSGQSFAFGRQYDSQRTIECSFDEQSNIWYDRNCFDALANQTNMSAEAIVTGSCSQETYCNRVFNEIN